MIRFLVLVLLIAAAGLLADATQSSAVAPAANVPGDVNCDGSLTPLDALDYLGSMAGTKTPPSCFATAGDLTCDENQDQADLIEILYALAGITRASCGGGAPTSLNLIGQALDRGEINEETATLYSVFWAFEDPRLPSQYDADDPPEMEMPVDMELIGSLLDEFSAGVRAQLEPFFIAPMHGGSWWDLRYNGAAAAPAGTDTVPGPILDGDWGYVDAGTANVKLWYPLNDFAMLQLANSAKQEIDSHIWPQLTGLMGRQPLPDGGSFTPGRGGDDRIDVIVSNDAPTFGAVGLSPNWCERTSAIIYADPEVAETLGVPFHIGVGHELMHAILFGYDLALQPGGNGGCANTGYNWWHEASATWTEDFLYPGVNTEHTGPRGDKQVKEFIGDLGNPLENIGDLVYGQNLSRPYGAYLWAFFAAHKYGDDIIRQMWENMQSQGSIEAMESALQPNGGFEMAWPEFVVSVINQAPFDNFRQWDSVEQEPDFQGSTYRDHEERVLIPEYPFTGGDGYMFLNQRSISHLAASVHSFKFVGDNIRTVTFHNGFAYNVKEEEEPSLGKFFLPEVRPAEETRGLKVQALIKIAGQEWQLEDWTIYSGRTFCRDKASERIEELVIIATNSVPEKDYEVDSPPGAQGARVQASDIACWRWEGTVTNRYYDTSDGFEEKIVLKDAVVEAIPYYEYTGQITFQYRLVQGSIDWDYNWAPGECVYHGSERGMHVTEHSTLVTYNGVIEGPYHRAADGSFSTEDLGQVTLTCPGDPPETFDEGVSATFPHDIVPFVLEDGAVIDGSFNLTPAPGMVGVEASWHFEAKRQ